MFSVQGANEMVAYSIIVLTRIELWRHYHYFHHRNHKISSEAKHNHKKVSSLVVN